MLVKQEYLNEIWIRVHQHSFAELLIVMRQGLPRVGKNPVRSLQAVDICMVFLNANECSPAHVEKTFLPILPNFGSSLRGLPVYRMVVEATCQRVGHS
jgi:hypothetical protein